MDKITPELIERLSYVKLIATLDEINRPPGGKDSIKKLVQNSFLDRNSRVLDVGCNTGFCSFEIAHLTHCKVTGIDISGKMIKTANRMLDEYHSDLKRNVNFIKADGKSLPFENGEFDLVMSGGSTAFITDIPRALSEYRRTTKDWGFVGDINFYYHSKPPKKLIDKINHLMGTKILPWPIKYWIDHYSKADLEMYYCYKNKTEPVTQEKILNYCTELVRQKRWQANIEEAAINRMFNIMTLFSENMKYLSYGVFILRKRNFREIILF